jgi:YVTN family beta-propeller protein
LVTLASGKVLFSAADADGSSGFLVEWDPKSGAFTNPAVALSNSGDLLLARSYDHTKVLVYTAGQNSAAIFDSASDSFGPVQPLPIGAGALNADGSRIAMLGGIASGGNGVTLFDGQFHVLATYAFNSQTVATDLIFSRDGSTVYVFTGGVAAALSTPALSLAGLVPIDVNVGADEPPDIDETGMVFAPDDRGLSFIDVSSPTGLGADEPATLSLSPAEGTLSSPSPTTFNSVGGLTNGAQLFFGAAPGSPQATPGTGVLFNSPSSIQVTPPAGAAPGAVNVTVVNPDGWLGIAKDGYTYGFQVLTVAPDSGPASGGTTVTVHCYGLSANANQVQVTVGGENATGIQVFDGPGISPFPFPMDVLQFTVPAGNPGAADVVITTPTGTATVPRGFHYVEIPQNYPIAGALAELAYDQQRQRLYATNFALNAVDVLDLQSGQFLPPIAVGKSPQGLAITPDGSKLVVVNNVDNSVSIINLSTSAVLSTISLANLTGLPLGCGSSQPYAVATISKNQAVIAFSCTQSLTGTLVLLDPSTETLGCGASAGCAAMVAKFISPILFVTSSGDGSKVFIAEGFLSGDDPVGLWDVTSDTFTSRPLAQAGFNAASADGTIFAKDFAFAGPDLFLSSLVQDVDYLNTGVANPNNVFGEKLHPSGALLYVPQTGGVDIYDSHRGHLVQRISLPIQVPATLDAMAIDETGTRLFLITQTGLSVVTLPGLPLSIGSVTPNEAPAGGGTGTTIRGSGFENGATVAFGAVQAAVTFVDASTLTLTAPALPPGPYRITITNPDGTVYSLDAAYTAN